MEMRGHRDKSLNYCWSDHVTAAWGAVHEIKDADEVCKFIIACITAALNKIAPMEQIKVNPSKNLYRVSDTLSLMEERNIALRVSRKYKRLRTRSQP